MISHGNEVLLQLDQALRDVKEEYEIVNEDGSIEKWKMEKSVDEIKGEINADISKIQDELKDIISIRDAAWEKLKDKNYDLVSPPIV
jgi:D-ribose pyranose/furanose isomerase RbsD